MALAEDTLRFLRDLEAHNERDWFTPRKAEYEQVVREPMLDFCAALNEELKGPAPEYVTDPTKAVYRVYRDTRFSKDKRPYKTHVSALFWHRALGKDGGAGLYFHLSTKEFLVAAGLYQMPPAHLLPVREHIAANHERFTEILNARAVRQSFGTLRGDKLSRAPKGWPSEHPAVEYLKHKDLLLERSFPPEAGLGRGAVKATCRRFRALIPFVNYLNEPLLAAARRRRADPLRRAALSQP
jgi:uncharacterized protein (TIGR02453 family)